MIVLTASVPCLWRSLRGVLFASTSRSFHGPGFFNLASYAIIYPININLGVVVELLSGMSVSECRRRGLSSLRPSGFSGPGLYSLCKVSDSASLVLLSSNELSGVRDAASEGSFVTFDGIKYRLLSETPNAWFVEPLSGDAGDSDSFITLLKSQYPEPDPEVDAEQESLAAATKAHASTLPSPLPSPTFNKSASYDFTKPYKASDLKLVAYPYMNPTLWADAVSAVASRDGYDKIMVGKVVSEYRRLRRASKNK